MGRGRAEPAFPDGVGPRSGIPMERIFVVGCGALTCLGRDLESTWEGLLAGRSGIARHAALDPEVFRQDIAGMIADFGPGTGNEVPEVAKLEARSIHMAVESAKRAWSDAGLPVRSGEGDSVSDSGSGLDRDRVAVLFGSALGGMDLLEAETSRAAKRRSTAVSPYLVPGLIINQQAGQIAQALGLHGPSVAPANACASGGHAIALGGMHLRAGEADVAVCGAAESCFTPMIVNGFATMRALLGRNANDRSASDPSAASRPFSADRAGFILSEGAASVVLATESAVSRLGLRPRAELLSWALNSDGYHMAMPHGPRIEACLRTAIARAGLTPDDVDYYNAHGTSTKVNDLTETMALKGVFGGRARRMAEPGDGALAVSSLKGALGHSLGAASAIEAAACVRALETGWLPPTINHIPDPELDLDYVPNQARKADPKVALSASFGFGGTNNALIFRRLCDD